MTVRCVCIPCRCNCVLLRFRTQQKDVHDELEIGSREALEGSIELLVLGVAPCSLEKHGEHCTFFPMVSSDFLTIMLSIGHRATITHLDIQTLCANALMTGTLRNSRISTSISKRQNRQKGRGTESQRRRTRLVTRAELSGNEQRIVHRIQVLMKRFKMVKRTSA